MSYTNRKKLYESLETYRDRPLIAYITSIRPNFNGVMSSDSIIPIVEQIERIPLDHKKIDFLIISNGGDPITSLRIVSLLRERFDRISVLVPYVAYSAATILALGADEIVMHPYSNLGPVDPQLTVQHNNAYGVPESINFSSEDLRNYIDFIRNDVGLTDQKHLANTIFPLLKDIGAIPIGNAKRSQQLTLSLSEKMLSLHIDDTEKVKSIAKALNTSYYHHGYAVGRTEAQKIGLTIANSDKELENILWEIWKDFNEELQCNKTFDFYRELFDDQEANRIISHIPVVNIPANTPPDIAKQIIVENAQKTCITNNKSIMKRVITSFIESKSTCKFYGNDINISYWRNPDFSLGFNFTGAPTGWIDFEE